MGNYSVQSHVPIFLKLFKTFDIKSVFEYGIGLHSTPLFVENCDRVLSIEMNTHALDGMLWYDKVVQDLIALYASKETDFRGGLYVDQYSLSPADLEKQETIAENIPPFNRSENILKALHGYGGNVPVTQ